MGNRGGILPAVGALALLAACSAPAPAPVAQTTTPASASAKPPTTGPSSDAPALGPGPGSQPPTTPQPPPPNSPAEVTSACPFLGVTESSATMGVVLDAYAVEEAKTTQQDATTYHCTYASRTGGRQLLDLFVTVVPGTGQIPSLVTAWTKDCKGPAKPIGGVAGTTRTCSLDGADSGDVMVLVVKKSHGQTRLAELYVRPFTDEVYAKLAQLLTDRL
ncbi:hypothetical protein QRX60_47190 [Amycolatopsis mongoliensis]|uniref:DUF3558 domain-containing protein n=1 Tax=Amycolatopsis mongoliensis TaxID=715475 RepID=A0A9Y2NKU0_9PSEU|nr:hypothetical protein [Amycolatopsis sp. 4-36]WIY01530.1 hypothetical protein QRX60_47190 [Amycolatopsis sp. 4-36]